MACVQSCHSGLVRSGAHSCTPGRWPPAAPALLLFWAQTACMLVCTSLQDTAASFNLSFPEDYWYDATVAKDTGCVSVNNPMNSWCLKALFVLHANYMEYLYAFAYRSVHTFDMWHEHSINHVVRQTHLTDLYSKFVLSSGCHGGVVNTLATVELMGEYRFVLLYFFALYLPAFSTKKNCHSLL